MKSAVIVFPGSNCDRDAARALERLTGQPAHMVWHKDTSPPEALDRIRTSLVRYNANCATANSIGYHESITRFYMWLIGRFLVGIDDQSDWVAVTNGLVEFATLEVNQPLAYYRRDVLMSDTARIGWVPPDLRPME